MIYQKQFKYASVESSSVKNSGVSYQGESNELLKGEDNPPISEQKNLADLSLAREFWYFFDKKYEAI